MRIFSLFVYLFFSGQGSSSFENKTFLTEVTALVVDALKLIPPLQSGLLISPPLASRGLICVAFLQDEVYP